MITTATILMVSLMLFCVSATAQIEGYLGDWKPSNSEGATISKLRISESEGSTIVRTWGTCSTGTCDWGKQTASLFYPSALAARVNGISVIYDRKMEGVRYLVISILPDRSLQVRQMVTTILPYPIGRMFTNSFVKTPNTFLPAPLMISPAADAKLNSKGFSLELKWMPVEGAISYRIDLEFYDRKAKKWTPLVENADTKNTRFLKNFVGNHWGRWRVRAVSVPGVDTETSAWRRFNYEMVKQQQPSAIR